MGGIPKGLERVGGERIVDRVAAALRGVADDLVVAANAPDAARWLPGVQVRADRASGLGGLAGVAAALELDRDVIVVAWDMPFVTTPLLAAIRDAASEQKARVVVPASDSPHGFEPFCAFYRSEVARELTQFLGSGGGAAHTFLERLVGVFVIPAADVARFGDARRLFFSVNSRADLHRARAMAEQTQ